MKTSRHSFLFVLRTTAFVLLPAVIFTLLAGCSSHHQYRTELRSGNPVSSFSDHNCVIERGTNYLIGFVELDDQGWLWDRHPKTNQMQTVLEALRAETTNGQGLLIFTFVHGWKHNADADDDYVAMFRKSLRRLAKYEKNYAETNGLTPRKIAGVYIGWRGLSQGLPLLRETTFWGRKNTAHEVGRGALAEVFLRLEALVNDTKLKAQEYRKTHPKDPHSTNGPVASRLTIVGHSFGGAATYSALAPLILERIITTEHTAVNDAPVRGFADMVVLVNPAFEAARFQILLDAVRRDPSQERVQTWPLNFAVFTSEADGATKHAFPVGRWLGTLFQSHQSRDERIANYTAVGHYGRFRTHDLVLAPRGTKLPTRSASGSTNAAATEIDPGRSQKDVRQNTGYEDIEAHQKTIDENKPKMQTAATRAKALREPLPLGKGILKPVSDDLHPPFILARVSKKIIPDHNTIDRDTFMHILTEFLFTLAPDERLQKVELNK